MQSFSLPFTKFKINWDEYLGHYILGARHFLLKEKPDSLPRARILLRRLYLLDKLVSVLMYGLTVWLMYVYWNNIVNAFESVLDYSSDFIDRRYMQHVE